MNTLPVSLLSEFRKIKKTMNKRPASCGPLRTALVLAVATVAVAFYTPRLQAQSPYPPEKMTYQGFLVDSSGTALGNAAPKNYDVIFRIYSSQTGSNPNELLWSEQQTITVDKGYFSVLLGEGAPTGQPRPALSTLFKGNGASDRYVGTTVKGIGPGTSNVDILPRLRLMSAPYAFLAQNAVKLVQNNGSDLIASSGNSVNVSGPITATSFSGNSANIQGTLTATTFSGNGASLTSLNAGSIANGTLDSARIANLEGAKIDNGSVSVDKLVQAVRDALVPPGTIIAYGGDSPPAGWLICNGANGYNPASLPALFAIIGYRFGGFTSGGVHYFLTPDLRGRFLRGRDGGVGRDPESTSRTAMYSEGATGDNVGSVQDDQFKAHKHTWLGSNGNNSPANVDFTANEFGSKNENQDTSQTGGTETRPKNANVNYIIKI